MVHLYTADESGQFPSPSTQHPPTRRNSRSLAFLVRDWDPLCLGIEIPGSNLTTITTTHQTCYKYFKPECLHISNSLYMRRVSLNGRLQLLVYLHGTSKYQYIFQPLALQLQTRHHQRSFDLSGIWVSDENSSPLNTWMTHLLYSEGQCFCLRLEDMLGCGKDFQSHKL